MLRTVKPGIKIFIYIYADALSVVVQGSLCRLSPTPLLGRMRRQTADREEMYQFILDNNAGVFKTGHENILTPKNIMVIVVYHKWRALS